MATNRHITMPAGFSTAGVACGLKRSGKRDVAVIACDRPASTAVVTTRNQVVGEPIKYVRSLLPRGWGKTRATVINAGNANVCTGKQGYADAEEMASIVAKGLDCHAKQVLVASTGIIGRPLPMHLVRTGIERAAEALGPHDADAAEAIMTTDTRPKSAIATVRLGGKSVTVAGMAKGSGMIAPSLATMIGVITTDAAIAPASLAKALRAAVRITFNAVTVDSDTSTSDIVVAMASGAAGNRSLTGAMKDFAKFQRALTDVCAQLARAIVADGEGATRTVEITVRGAVNDSHAEQAAKAIANSPLVKCAVHGGDPNWGRIAAAAGKSSAKVDPDRLSISIGGVRVFAKGQPRKIDLAPVEEHMTGDEVKILCDFGLGDGHFTALTCDLSREYITINADYHT